MKIDVIDINGNKIDNVELSDKIFLAKPNKKVIQSIVYWQLSHFKPRTAKNKTKR